MNGEAIRRNQEATRRSEEAILRTEARVIGVETNLEAFRREVGERLERLEAA